jgi:hypothetical protein
LSEEELRDDYSAQESKNSGTYDVGQIMRADVHSRETDQDRDWQTGETDPPACKN